MNEGKSSVDVDVALVNALQSFSADSALLRGGSLSAFHICRLRREIRPFVTDHPEQKDRLMRIIANTQHISDMSSCLSRLSRLDVDDARLPLAKHHHPCFMHPHSKHIHLREPGLLSMFSIGVYIREWRLFCDTGDPQNEHKLTQTIQSFIDRFNHYPDDYIEIIANPLATTASQFRLQKVSLLGHRPAMITIADRFIAADNTSLNEVRHGSSSMRVWVLGQQLAASDSKQWKTTSLPSPQSLIQLYHAGVDIVHFYDTRLKRFIQQDDTKRSILSTLRKSHATMFDLFVPLYLVSRKYQEPFIAVYNCLMDRQDGVPAIARLIVAYACNESKFEDVAYLEFVVDVVCDHCVLAMPTMLKSWRNWVMRNVCLKWNGEQLECMQLHIANNQVAWRKFVSDMMTGTFLLDCDSWIWFASQYCSSEACYQMDSQPIVDALNLFISRYAMNKSNMDLQRLLVDYKFHFDAVAVWTSPRTRTDCPLGLLWYFMITYGDDDGKQVHESFMKYLRGLYASQYEVWFTVCIETYLCNLFFKYCGSLKQDRKTRCMRNTLKLLSMFDIHTMSDMQLQVMYLEQCLLSCNADIWQQWVSSGLLDIHVMKGDLDDEEGEEGKKKEAVFVASFCVRKLFSAFESKLPLVQSRLCRQMVLICRWLCLNDLKEDVDVVCGKTCEKIESFITKGNRNRHKWQSALLKLQSAREEWTQS